MSKLNYHLLIIILFAFSVLFTGCAKEKTPEKTKSLDFTIVTGADIPDELKSLIKERKQNAFELTYSDNNCLYIIKGYGKQKTGGYNIKINDFYESENSLVFDTDLFGPKTGTKKSNSPSFPYIVIKTEYRESPVEFI